MGKHKRGKNGKKEKQPKTAANFLSLIPYHEVPHEKVKLPKRQAKGDYVEPDYPFRWIPEKY